MRNRQPSTINRRPLAGFTLIELSVVLIIIALITSSILAGQSILRDAHIKRITNDAEHYKGMVALFQSQYQALPGDFRNASRLWGSTCNSGTSSVCSGNGDNLIEDEGDDSLSNTSETLLVWQHLSKAEILTADYSGMPASGCSGTNCVTPGENAPKGSLNTSSFYLHSLANGQTVLIMGGKVNDSWNSGPLLTPFEAYSIDKKIDDSVNDTGDFMGAAVPDGSGGWLTQITNGPTNCYTSSTSTHYNTSTDNPTCGAIFILGTL